MNNQDGFNSDNFRNDYFEQKRDALFRLIELQNLVDHDSDNMKFTEDEKPKLDRLKALNEMLYHLIEEIENT